MASANGEQASTKMKLLCLHGFTQTADVFRMRLGSMRKAMKSQFEYCFMDAPFPASASLTEEQLKEMGGRGGGFSWWQWKDVQEGDGNRPSKAAIYMGWEESYEKIKAAVKENGADALLGFSQGATATAMFIAQLTLRHQQQQDLDIPMPRLAIMISGFLPRHPESADMLSLASPSVPSLFVYGTSDTLVPPERTVALMQTFDERCRSEYVHDGAHLVPTCSGGYKQALVGFTQEVVQQQQAAAELLAAAVAAGLVVADEGGVVQKAEAVEVAA